MVVRILDWSRGLTLMASSKVIRLGEQEGELNLHNSTEQDWLEENLDRKEWVGEIPCVDSWHRQHHHHLWFHLALLRQQPIGRLVLVTRWVTCLDAVECDSRTALLCFRGWVRKQREKCCALYSAVLEESSRRVISVLILNCLVWNQVKGREE